LPSGYSVFGGAEWERKSNPVMPNNTAIYGTGGLLVRETTDESGARLGVRKAMSEDLNGALSVEFKQRRSGDDWKSGDNKKGNTVITVSSLGNYVLPDMYMDRDRTKVRANLEWDPSEALSVQAVVEHAQDDYLRSWTSVSQVILTVPGARTVSTDSVTLDATYKLTDAWKLSGYWTHTENRWNVNKASLGDDTKNMTDTIGFGVSGKASARLSVGADLLAANDVTKFNNYSATSNVGGLGNIAGWTGQSLPGNSVKLNLYGVYEVDKKSLVKLNLAYQEFKADDWQWGYNGVPFVYSDNTTVSNPNQTVTFLGAAYVLKF
jgi:hypothetical protein